MSYRTVSILTLGILVLLLALASPSEGNDAVANSAYESLIAVGANTVKAIAPTSGLTVQVQTGSSWSCLPHYSEPDEFLHLYPHEGAVEIPGSESVTTLWGVDSADFNDDGWPDAVLWRGLQPTGVALELDVLINDGQGSLVLGTSEVFSGTIPSVVEGRELVLADFNGDDRLDMFFADQGMDTDPFPGYQNTLVLSVPGGKMVDATSNLPQQWDQTHSATAADIDGDDDIDLYVGNLGGGEVPPQIWLNNGAGVFSVAEGLLPPEQTDLPLNWYTTCKFADVNNDTSPDLILGQGNPHRDSHVLLNDGTGSFSQMETPLPPTIFAPIQGPLDIKSTDISGDGYLDLFLVDTRNTDWGRYIQILINNGDGTFRDETSTRLPQSDNYEPAFFWVHLLDLDMDGHLDIVASPMGEQEPVFYLNEGNGTFRPLPNVFNIGTDNLFTFFDIDQDGFLDVLWSYPGCYDGTCPEVHFLVRALGCPVFLPLVCRNDSPTGMLADSP
jgi:hypothetical protein